jgi:hypothetical protein
MAATPPCTSCWAPGRGRTRTLLDKPGNRGRGSLPVRRDQEAHGASPGWFVQAAPRDQGRVRRDHHRRASPLPADGRRATALPGDQRQRQRDQVEIRQQVRLQGIAGGRHPPRHRRDDGRQGRRRLRLWRCRQGLGRSRCAAPAPACQGDRDRPDLRPAGGHGRLRGGDAGR